MKIDYNKPFRWNVDKNNQLQRERQINFQTAILAILDFGQN